MTAEGAPTDTIAGGWAAWRERVKSGKPTHGMGPSRYLPGDVQHLVSPLVGMLRLMECDGETPDAEDVEYLIDRLSFVLDIAREDSSLPVDALVATDPQAVLDALTRAGVLTEECALRFEKDLPTPTMDGQTESTQTMVMPRDRVDAALAAKVPIGGRNRRAVSRFVTVWREVESSPHLHTAWDPMVGVFDTRPCQCDIGHNHDDADTSK